MNPAGDTTRWVITAPFAARRVIFGPDGTLWAFGRVYDNNFNDLPDYATLRHYDAQGKLIGTALPRSAFPAGKFSPSHDCLLAATGDRIGIYSHGAARWAEVSLEGALIGMWEATPLQNVLVTGIGMTSAGVFASVQNQCPPGSSTADCMLLQRFNKVEQSLTPVDTAQIRTADQGIYLMGSDGDRLVARVHPRGSIMWLNVD